MIAVYALMSEFRFIEALNRSALIFQSDMKVFSPFFFAVFLIIIIIIILLHVAILWTSKKRKPTPQGSRINWTKIPFGTFVYSVNFSQGFNVPVFHKYEKKKNDDRKSSA